MAVFPWGRIPAGTRPEWGGDGDEFSLAGITGRDPEFLTGTGTGLTFPPIQVSRPGRGSDNGGWGGDGSRSPDPAPLPS